MRSRDNIHSHKLRENISTVFGRDRASFAYASELECLVANFEVPHPLLAAIQKQQILPQIRGIYCKTDSVGFEAFNLWLGSFERQDPLPTNIKKALIFCGTMVEIARREYLRKSVEYFYMDLNFYVDEEFYVGQDIEGF